MYNNPSVPAAAGVSGALAMTGANVFWIALAGFAMLALGLALMRIVPKKAERRK